MIAHVCKLKAKEFIHSIGDAHVYLTHIDALKEQIKRAPRKFPKLIFRREISCIDDFKISDFVIQDYNPYSSIKINICV